MEDNTKNNNSDVLITCLGGCCILTTSLALLGCAIAYIVFGIMYLVQDYQVAHDCNGSSLWAYVLTALILCLLRTNSKNIKDEDDNLNVCVLVCLGFIELGLAIWGGVELWVNSCDNLVNTNIWIFGLVTFILQTFVSSLLLVIIPTLFLVLACCKKTEVDDEDDRKQTDNNLEYKPTNSNTVFDNV